MSERTMNVGTLPLRNGVWLSLQEGTRCTPLAKFRSEEAARMFLEAVNGSGAYRGERS